MDKNSRVRDAPTETMRDPNISTENQPRGAARGQGAEAPAGVE